MTQDRITRPNTIHHPKLIAHRGYTPVAPENSLPAFEAAGKEGFWAIETDVHKSLDGVLVCNHDPATDRMYDGSGAIAQMTYDGLMRLRLAAGDGLEGYPEEALRMPTFRSILPSASGMGQCRLSKQKQRILRLYWKRHAAILKKKMWSYQAFVRNTCLWPGRFQKRYSFTIFLAPRILCAG